MINIVQRGNFNHIEKFFQKMKDFKKMQILDKYGKLGVEALSAATPKKTGKTAASWTYEVIHEGSYIRVVWSNSNINEGENIALLIQMGHGTRLGGYVEGLDYINPAIKPIFEQMPDEVWREVTNA